MLLTLAQIGDSFEFQGGKVRFAACSIVFVRTLPLPQQTFFCFRIGVKYPKNILVFSRKVLYRRENNK